MCWRRKWRNWRANGKARPAGGQGLVPLALRPIVWLLTRMVILPNFDRKKSLYSSGRQDDRRKRYRFTVRPKRQQLHRRWGWYNRGFNLPDLRYRWRGHVRFPYQSWILLVHLRQWQSLSGCNWTSQTLRLHSLGSPEDQALPWSR